MAIAPGDEGFTVGAEVSAGLEIAGGVAFTVDPFPGFGVGIFLGAFGAGEGGGGEHDCLGGVGEIGDEGGFEWVSGGAADVSGVVSVTARTEFEGLAGFDIFEERADFDATIAADVGAEETGGAVEFFS